MGSTQAIDLQQIQTELDALYQQRSAIWDAAYQQIKSTEAQQKAQERIIQDRRSAAQQTIDQQIDAIVQAYTGRAGVRQNDVVRFLNDYGDMKRDEFGVVTSVSADGERIAVELDRGATSAHVNAVALVIDPNLRDAWKLHLIAKYVLSAAQYKYFDPLNCASKLSEADELVAGLMQRLDGAS